MSKLDNKNLVSDYTESLWGDFKAFIVEYFHDKYVLQDKVFFTWQYCRNPFVIKNTSVKVLLLKDRFLGYLGFIPVRLKVFDKIFNRSALLCNLMIDKSCRALGLGSYLIRELEQEFTVLFGTGYTLKTGPMYEKLGDWKLMGNLNRYIKIIDKKKVNLLLRVEVAEDKRADVVNSDISLNIKSVEHFTDDIKKFWKKISFKYPIAVQRDVGYLNWRYAEHPFFCYHILVAKQDSEIKGYIIFRITKSDGCKTTCLIGHILDLISTDDAVSPLVAEAEKIMVKEKVDLIDYFSTGCFHHDDFIKLGYHDDTKAPYDKMPMYFNPVDLQKTNKINVLVYYGKASQYKEKLCDINNWYITKGDGDKDRPNPH